MSNGALIVRDGRLLMPKISSGKLAVEGWAGGTCCPGVCCSQDGTCTAGVAHHGCIDANSTFLEGETCDPNPCVGACCISEFPYPPECQILSKPVCLALGGSWQGYGSCDGIHCPTLPCELCQGGYMPYGLEIIEWALNANCGNANMLTWKELNQNPTIHDMRDPISDCCLSEYLPQGEPVQFPAKYMWCGNPFLGCEDNCFPPWYYLGAVAEGACMGVRINEQSEEVIYFSWGGMNTTCCDYEVDASHGEVDLGRVSEGPVDCNGTWEKTTVVVPDTCGGGVLEGIWNCHYKSHVTFILGNGGSGRGESLLYAVRQAQKLQSSTFKSVERGRSGRVIISRPRNIILPSRIQPPVSSRPCSGCGGRGRRIVEAWPSNL